MFLSPQNAPSSGVRIELRRNLRTLRPSKPWNDKPSISVKWFLFSSLQKSTQQSNRTWINLIPHTCQPAMENYIIICYILVGTVRAVHKWLTLNIDNISTETPSHSKTVCVMGQGQLIIHPVYGREDGTGFSLAGQLCQSVGAVMDNGRWISWTNMDHKFLVEEM